MSYQCPDCKIKAATLKLFVEKLCSKCKRDVDKAVARELIVDKAVRQTLQAIARVERYINPSYIAFARRRI